VEPYGADYHITLALREPPAFFAHGSQARAVMHSAGWCRVMVVCLFDSDNEDAAHYAYRCEDELTATWEGRLLCPRNGIT
jgi:hypothetical protein